MADMINTDINSSEGEWGSADTVEYDNSSIGDIQSDLSTAIEYLEDLKTQIDGMSSYDSCWKGEAKGAYEDLKNMLIQYQSDYLESVKNLNTVVDGISTLLGNVPNANVIKEIDAL